MDNNIILRCNSFLSAAEQLAVYWEQRAKIEETKAYAGF